MKPNKVDEIEDFKAPFDFTTGKTVFKVSITARNNIIILSTCNGNMGLLRIKRFTSEIEASFQIS